MGEFWSEYDSTPPRERPRRGPDPLEQGFDRLVSAGRQLVGGVSGARPGSRTAPKGAQRGEKTAGQAWIGWAAGWRTNLIGSSMRTRIGANHGRSLSRGKACPGNLFNRSNRLGVAPWRRSLAGDGLALLGLAKTIGPTTPVFQSPVGNASPQSPSPQRFSRQRLMPQIPRRQAPVAPCPVPPDAAGPSQVSSAGEKTSRITVSSLPPRKKR